MSYFQSFSFLSCEFYKGWRPWMYLDCKHSPHFHPENNLIRFTGDGEILQVYEAKLPWLDQQIMSRRDFTFDVTLLVTSSAPRATPHSRAMPIVPNVPLYQNLTWNYYIPWKRAYWMSFHTAFANTTMRTWSLILIRISFATVPSIFGSRLCASEVLTNPPRPTLVHPR